MFRKLWIGLILFAGCTLAVQAEELDASLSEAVAGYTRQAGYEVAEERA